MRGAVCEGTEKRCASMRIWVRGSKAWTGHGTLPARMRRESAGQRRPGRDAQCCPTLTGTMVVQSMGLHGVSWSIEGAMAAVRAEAEPVQ